MVEGEGLVRWDDKKHHLDSSIEFFDNVGEGFRRRGGGWDRKRHIPLELMESTSQ